MSFSKKKQVYAALDPPRWTLNPERLKKCFTERTKAIVLNRLRASPLIFVT